MSNLRLDIGSNRRATKYGRKEQVLRILWALVTPFFRYSPRICFGWRNFLLRLFRAQVGKNTHVYNSAVIYMPWNLKIGDESSIGEWALIYNLGPINIGNQTTISQRVHLCAGSHDYTNPALPLLKLPINVKDQVWICADAFVGPDITVGEGAVVGARAVVARDVDPWAIVAGNPAKFIKSRVLKDT